MRLLSSDRGDLLLPILAVLFLFGMFWITYVSWCRHVYWKMRTEMTAENVALSAAREQATLLNYLATSQMAETSQLPKVPIFGADIAIVTAGMAARFKRANDALKLLRKTFVPQVILVASLVGRANGLTIPPVPLNSLADRLEPHTVTVGVPVPPPVFLLVTPFDEAYYTRTWSPGILKAQPPHAAIWMACHGKICETGRAGLWLDVDPSDKLNNGGFPTDNPGILRGLGIQCFYPQFNARLLSNQGRT